MDSPVMGSIFSLTESNSPNFPKYSWAERHLLHWIGRPDTRISHQLICHLKLKWTCKSSWEASWGNPPTKSFLSSSSPILNLISEINRNSLQNWTNVYMFQMYLCCRHFDYIYKIFWLSQTNRALQFSITWYHSILQFEPSQIFRKKQIYRCWINGSSLTWITRFKSHSETVYTTQLWHGYISTILIRKRPDTIGDNQNIMSPCCSSGCRICHPRDEQTKSTLRKFRALLIACWSAKCSRCRTLSKALKSWEVAFCCHCSRHRRYHHNSCN